MLMHDLQSIKFSPKIMRKNGKILKKILDVVCAQVTPGISTEYLNNYAKNLMGEMGVESACFGYGNPGFPGHICVSVNDTICHGIPSKSEILMEGDIISIDICIRKDGHYSDSCRTVAVGKISAEAQRLINCSQEITNKVIKEVRAGQSVSTLAYLTEKLARESGYATSDEFAGHGIGLALHEDPNIPFCANPWDKNCILRSGQCITIEPMIVKCPTKRAKITILSDGWTAKTNGLSAQFEHTILVKDNGYEILT
jgi:methionyl aminopeptidase